MLLDSQNMFCNYQRITTDCTSDNVVAMGKGDPAFGTPKPLLIQVVEDFVNADYLNVAIETCRTPNFATNEEIREIANCGLSGDQLYAGNKFGLTFLPKGNLGFMRLRFDIHPHKETTGQGDSAVTTTLTITQGAVTAGLVAAHDNSWHDMAEIV